MILTKLHFQRIASAVAAAHTGARISFRVNRGDVCQVVWTDLRRPRVQHMIASVPDSVAHKWCSFIQGEYERQLTTL